MRMINPDGISGQCLSKKNNEYRIQKNEKGAGKIVKKRARDRELKGAGNKGGILKGSRSIGLPPKRGLLFMLLHLIPGSVQPFMVALYD